MIELVALTARRGKTELRPVSYEIKAGRHALLGGPEDGAPLLLACIAGELRPRRGKVTVLHGSPHDPRVRARVGWVPLGVELPEVLRVDEALALAWRIRGGGGPSPDAALATLGLDALRSRRIRTLDAGEVRAVALAEALAAPTVSVLLVEEPLVAMAAPAAAVLPRALQAAEHAGKTVVVSTASSRDASRLATNILLFELGAIVSARATVSSESPRLRVAAADVRALAAALAQKPVVERLELVDGAVVVGGSSFDALAGAVNEAVATAGVEITRIEVS